VWCAGPIVAVLCVFAAACGDSEEQAPRQRHSAQTQPGSEVGGSHEASEPEPQKIALKEPPLYGDDVRSLRLTRSIAPRSTPVGDASRLGTVARDTRVLWKRAVAGPDCESRWIEIEPRGWICEQYLEPSGQAPGGVEMPKLLPGELVPGEYGKIVGDDALLLVRNEEDGSYRESPLAAAMTVRRYGEAYIDGALHWRIGRDRFVDASSVRPHVPSPFQGARLADETGLTLPMGFAVSSKRPGDWVAIYKDKTLAARVRRLPPRSPVRLLETESLGYRIGEGEWIAADDVQRVEPSVPPPATLADERWIDVDLDRQILVAYEGTLPVYATLISSGTRKNPTETGIYRIWIKFAETDMNGRMGESDAYSVATVPWTQFYGNDLALHTSYWHDGFGRPRSHGCVNLSPRDARFLYFWSDPNLPHGWSMSNGNVDAPGSMVRVRSAADPEPEFVGYADDVYRARTAGDKTARIDEFADPSATQAAKN